MILKFSRAQIPGRRTAASGLLQVGRAASPATVRSRPAPWLNRALLGSRVISRSLYIDPKNLPTGIDLSPTSTRIEDIRLRNEFEENKDVREYLRKWQDINPNVLDPIQAPESRKPDQMWVGNMLNDSMEAFESAGDFERMNREEAADLADFADEEESLHSYLEPGDLVALKCGDEILRFAIYVRSIYRQQQFYTERGKWRVALPQDLDYVIKGFVPPQDVSVLHPYFPNDFATLSPEMQNAIEGGVPRNVGADLLVKINDFNLQVQELYRSNSLRFDSIYDIVAHEEEQLQVTLEDLACKALEIAPDKLNDVILYGVHRAVCQNPFLMERDRSSLWTNHYVVLPTRTARILERVLIWVREHQNYLVRAETGREISELKTSPIQNFVRKVQRLIRLSRRIRSPTTMSNVGPTSQRFVAGQDGKPMVYREMVTEPFTQEDKTILEFLRLWCTPPRRMAKYELRAAGSHIMRSTKMYSEMELNTASVPLLLQELGVFTPWENLQLFDRDLALPGHGNQKSDAMLSAVESACEKLNRRGVVDQMAELRNDWGDLPVYCIDDIDAGEIDDGVSLEPVPGSDDTFWVHVHVANPTAFIDPQSTIVKYAASRLQTLYTPDRTYPMLPKSLTEKHFSLAPDRPTMTFSVKMKLDGEILDTDVSNGTVRNVIYITHDKVRSLLDPSHVEDMAPLTVGGEFTPQHSRTGLRETLTPGDKDTLRTLRQLMLGFRQYRLQNGAIDWTNNASPSVAVSFGSAPAPPSKPNLSAGRYVLGDPIIRLHQKNFNPHEVPDATKRYLVSTLMNMACWVSARWCAERNIPVVYDGTYYHPEYPHLTNENISEWGGDGWFQLGPPKGVSASHPIPHTPLGLDAYVKSTSPLRRYTDVLAHHQIEAALRFEHKHGRRFDGDNPDDLAALPYTHADVDEYINTTRWLRNRLRICDQGSKQFWACLLLFRAFYFGECDLPETFDCMIRSPSIQMQANVLDESYYGTLTTLGVMCEIKTPPDIGPISALSVVEAKVVGVNLARSRVYMQATRLVKPFKRVGEWA
ncbi:hypothetical protein BJY01DRAFT_217208 [Aspergillus pseudoustus]|uniref:RNB domain-containing protein n=1 Tax=Aspergillus pseudoustus TaxID=1810923 RepID=A0ABR4JNS8_9EURO